MRERERESMDDSPVSSGAMVVMKEEKHSHGTAMSDGEREQDQDRDQDRDRDRREKAVGDERDRRGNNGANRLVLHLPNPTRYPPPPLPLPPHPPTMIQRTKMESGSGRLIRLTIATKREPDNNNNNNNNSNNNKEEGNGDGNDNASKTMTNKSSAQSEWTPESITTLLRCYSEKFACGRGYLLLNDWQDVVDSVNRHYTGELAVASKTMKQCREKLDSLKRRYKVEKKKKMMKKDKQASETNDNDNGDNLSSWRYFHELDEMMRSQPKFARIPGGVDAGVKLPFADRTYDPLKKGKMPIEDTNDNDNDDDTEDGYTTPSCSDRTLPSPPPTKKKKKHHVSAKKCKRSSDPDNAFQALADAVLGFADVFARIEMAKMEILTKMKLEMAKLDRKHRKTRDSSSLSSESE